MPKKAKFRIIPGKYLRNPNKVELRKRRQYVCRLISSLLFTRNVNSLPLRQSEKLVPDEDQHSEG